MDSITWQTYFEHVKNHPFYQGIYEGINDYTEAPVLHKAMLQELLETRFCVGNETQGVYLVRSGGTTQRPLLFPVDIRENLSQRETFSRALLQAHIITPRTVGLNLFTYGLMYRTASILDDIFERCGATTLPISAEAANADVAAAVAHFRPDMLFGSPSRMALFAQYVKENGLTVSFPNLLFGGEFMLPSYQRLFEEVFQTRNIYALYGSAETGIWAWSCYGQRPSLYQVIEGVQVEIVEPDAQGFGNIVVTNFYRCRFPVFRYGLGDIGRWTEVGGEKYLELRSRNEHSFFLDSANFYVDDFKEITAGADTFQIQLSSGENVRNTLRILLVHPMPEARQNDFLAEKERQLKAMMHLNKQLLDIRVQLAGIHELYMNRVTSKIPRVVDFRK